MSDTPLFTAGTVPASAILNDAPLRIVFDGKGTLKVRNGGWLSFLNRTTSRDFHDTLPLKADGSIDRVLLTDPVPVAASGSFHDGVLDLNLKVLGFATIPVFHKQVAKRGDSIPINWSVKGSSLVGKVTVS